MANITIKIVHGELGGETHNITVSSEDTVQMLIKKIAASQGIEEQRISLAFRQTPLDRKEKKLVDYGIVNHSKIAMVLR
jgi:uncharacterized ubiquitin-like protein YukD